jgi:hypothetical protein
MFILIYFNLNQSISNKKTAQMYQHPSIVNPVRIYITHIIYLSQINDKVIIFYMALYLFNSKKPSNKKATENFEIFWDAEKTLGNFCKWQKSFRESRGMHNTDAAVLITK